MIYGKNLMFSSSVQNTLEYYGNVLFMIILKGSYFPTNLRALVQANMYL